MIMTSIVSQVSTYPNKQVKGLLSLEELFEYRAELGLPSGDNEIRRTKKELQRIEELGFLSENKLVKKYLEGNLNIDTYNWRHNGRRYLWDYLLINMYAGRMPFNKTIINDAIFSFTGVTSRFNILIEFYNNRKPSYLPSLLELTHRDHKQFLINLVIFNEINTEEKLLAELFNVYRGNTVQIKQLNAKITEFASLIYPCLVNGGIMAPKGDIINYLYNKYHNVETLTEEQKLWNYLTKQFNEEHKHSEFYTVCKLFVEDCLNHSLYQYATIRPTIYHWFQLTDICIKEGIKKIDEITSYHRVLYIKTFEGTSLINDFMDIRKVIEFYNITFNKTVDLNLFSYKHANTFISDVKHVTLMESGFNALVGILASHIMKTRHKPFRLMHMGEKHLFFTCRLIWVVILTGARKTEITELKLNIVMNSMDFKSPYLIIFTRKGSKDREYKIERGKYIQDGEYEYDFITYDIFTELIEAAKEVYGKIAVENQFLFPSIRTFSALDRSITEYFRRIQLENGIICGSSYDILNHDLYASYPVMSEKLNSPTPLFTLHDLRHINVDKLLVQGKLNRFETAKEIGWQNINSQDHYSKTYKTMFQISQQLEENGHYSAENELVSPNYTELHKEDSVELTNTEDLNEYLDSLENRNIYLPPQEANDFIDSNTQCKPKVKLGFWCGETGISCTGCGNFESGELTVFKLERVGALIEIEYKSIDYLIDNLNNTKNITSKKHIELLHQYVTEIIERFERVNNTKEITLLSTKNFGMAEKDADRFIGIILRNTRNKDIDKKIIDYIKDLRKKDKLSIMNIELYRTSQNRAVFQ